MPQQLAWDPIGFTTYGSWAPETTKIQRLATTNLRDRWVSANATTSFTRVQWATQAQSVALVGLMSHNMSLSATIQLTASNDSAFGSTLYNSGTINVWPAGVTAASRQGLRWNWWHRLPTPSTAQYWRIQITDTGNSAGFVSAGRLFLATKVWQPSINMLGGAGLGFESTPDMQTTVAGTEWIEAREAARYARFTLAQMPEAEMMDSAFDLLRVGASANREVLFVWETADGVHAPRRTLFGRLRNLSALEVPYATQVRGAFEVKEAL